MIDTTTNNTVKPPRYLFLIGAPRSGTTWLQLLLAQNPTVATTSETHLFTQYFNLLEKRWRHETGRLQDGHKVNGLTQLIDEKEFYSVLRSFADRVLTHSGVENSGATLFMEKTPENTLHAGLISRVYPEAYFLHIIRDPRAVVSSFSNAAKTWWAWAPTGPISVTRRWRDNIKKGRYFGDLTDRYLEVRYEDLVSDGSRELLRIWEWLEIRSDIKQCDRAIQACQIDNLKSGSDDVVKPWSIENEPEGFFREGGINMWREEMSDTDISAVEYIAGDLLDELGYESATKPGYRLYINLIRFRITEGLYKGVRCINRSLEWKLRRALAKL